MAFLHESPAGSDLEGNTGKITAIYLFVLLAAAVILAMVAELGAPPSLIGTALVGLTLAAYGVIGLVARSRRPADFFFAGRSAAPAALGMALAAQWTGSIGMALLLGTLYGLGFDGLAFVIGPLAGLVLMGVLVAPYLCKLGVTTTAEFCGVRYGALPRTIAVIITFAALAPLLVAQLQGFALVAHLGFGQPAEWAVGIAAAVVLASALPGGQKGLTWTQAAQYLAVAAAVVVPAVALSVKLTGLAPPHLAFGAALERIGALEPELIEKGLASASTLKPHAAPFLSIDAKNFLALVVVFAAGVAALPHLTMQAMSARRTADARFTVAWAAFFALIVAATLPATAALAKLHVYTMISQGTRFADLPGWMEEASRQDRVRIHGVSLAMLDEAALALGAGASDVAAVEAHLEARGAASAAGFATLRDTVKAAVIEGASRGGESWEALRMAVLPIAARADGNRSGKLTEQGLWIAPASLMLSLPGMIAMPSVIAALTLAGTLAAALAAASGSAHALAATLGQDLLPGLVGRGAPERRRLLAVRLVLLAVVGAAAAAALYLPDDVTTLALWSFALAAGGLFPALVLGIWWKRTNVWGASLGMLVGFTLPFACLAGTQFFPVEMHVLTSHFSAASDIALRRMESLEAAWSGAEGEAKLAARAALESYARGGPTSPGAANVFGLVPIASGALGMLAGLAVIVLVSLVTPRPWAEAGLLIDEMRRPGGRPILDEA